MLITVVVRRRFRMPFHHLFWMFGGFIVFCGFTHFFDVYTFYVPSYRQFLQVARVIEGFWLELVTLPPDKV